MKKLLLLVAVIGAVPWQIGHADEPKLEKLQPGLVRGVSKEILAIVNRGRQLRNQGDRETALAVFEDALRSARTAADKPGEAWALNNIASIYRYDATDKDATDKRGEEHAQRATALYEQARAFALLNGDKHNAAYATLYLGVLAEQRNEVEQAKLLFESALPLFKEVSDPYYTARNCALLGRLTLAKLNDPKKALIYFEQALEGFREAELWSDAAIVAREMITAYEKLANPQGRPAP